MCHAHVFNIHICTYRWVFNMNKNTTSLDINSLSIHGFMCELIKIYTLTEWDNMFLCRPFEENVIHIHRDRFVRRSVRLSHKLHVSYNIAIPSKFQIIYCLWHHGHAKCFRSRSYLPEFCPLFVNFFVILSKHPRADAKLHCYKQKNWTDDKIKC